jgi:predicted ATPase
LTSLVGRDAESEAVLSLLDERRLVTLVGEGGCGKTRLALRVASSAVGRSVDGVWFVDLTPVAAGADMASRIADVIGLSGGLDELVSVFAERDVLVVLDNCEHVLASTTGVVATMLSECPTLRVLATSRAPLDVPGEALFRVPPLELPRRGASAGEAIGTDAVQLFVERARLVRPGFEVTEGNVNAVVDVCTRLEGLPLAIELAAARLRALSVEDLRRDLGDRFAVLVGGPKSAPERHRTLRAAVEWSFQPLDPVERAVLFRLAPFHGGADLDSVRAVCDGDLAPSVGVLDILIRLVDKSLVTVADDDPTTRYGMHETIRDYAAAAGSALEGEAAGERHARWFARLATQLAAGPEPGDERAWIRRHNVERENLRAAIEWLLVRDPPAALRLCLDVARGGYLLARWSWCQELIGRILPLVTRGWEAERAEALGVLASAALETDPSDAARLVADAVELLDSVDDPVARCWVLSVAARYHAEISGGYLDLGDVSAAVAEGDRAGGTYWPFMARHDLSHRAHPSLSESLNRDALRIAEQQHLDLFAAMSRALLAVVAQFRGDSALALSMAHQLLPMVDDLFAHSPGALEVYPLIEGEHGDLAVGRHLAEHLLFRRIARPHDPGAAAGLYAVVAHLRRLAGDADGAETAVEQARRGFGEARLNFVVRLAHVTRSALWRARGKPQLAAQSMAYTCDAIWFQGLTDIEMRVLEELAAVATALGRCRDGADLLTTARDARQRHGKPASPACRRDTAPLEAQLSEYRGRPLRAGHVKELAHSLADH